MRNSRGFTLIEMLVVVLIIIILIGIGLAVGEQVQASSELALTKSELKGLQGALEWYQHKTAGQTPTDMLAFLEGYQRLHAYSATVGGKTVWQQHKNFLTNLPATAVVTGTFPAPGAAAGGQTMTGVIEILDGLGHPIQYVPASFSAATIALTNVGTDVMYPYPQVAGVTGLGVYGTYSVTPTGQFVFLPTLVTNNNADTAPMPLPGQVHAPCFFSFGTGYNASNPSVMVYNSYTYSYNP